MEKEEEENIWRVKIPFFAEEDKKESIRREMLGARKIFKSVLFYICALGLVCF